MLPDQKERPPYVQFELRPVEDRVATLANGHYSTKDVAFAIITPAGGKDTVERIADEWLAMLKKESMADPPRFPPAWYQSFQAGYDAWKLGQSIPDNGTPIRTWAVLSPSQIISVLNANIRTVEDLAAANDEALGRIGLGGQELKRRAVDWLTQAAGPGKIAMKLEELIAKVNAQEAQIKGLSDTNEKLRMELQSKTPVPPPPAQQAQPALRPL